MENVNFFIEKLLHFSEFFPKYKGLKLYGAVAGIRIEEESDRYADPSQQAQGKGLFVLTLSEEGMFASLTDLSAFGTGRRLRLTGRYSQ